MNFDRALLASVINTTSGSCSSRVSKKEPSQIRARSPLAFWCITEWLEPHREGTATPRNVTVYFVSLLVFLLFLVGLGVEARPVSTLCADLSSVRVDGTTSGLG